MRRRRPITTRALRVGRRRATSASASSPDKTRRAFRAVLERFFGVHVIATAHIIPVRNVEEGGVGRHATHGFLAQLGDAILGVPDAVSRQARFATLKREL